jgi:hypothetical protein
MGHPGQLAVPDDTLTGFFRTHLAAASRWSDRLTTMPVERQDGGMGLRLPIQERRSTRRPVFHCPAGFN